MNTKEIRFTVLHLTDIHIKHETDAVLKRAKNIAAACFVHLRQAQALIVAITGDIAHSGQQKEYDLALTFLEGVVEEIKKEFKGRIILSACPGNHDCLFPEAEDKMRDLVIDKILADQSEIDTSYTNACVAVQDNFFAFLTRLSGEINIADKLKWSVEVTVDERKVKLVSLNLSYLSKKKEQVGNIFFPFSSYTAETDDHSIIFTLAHHPWNWISQQTTREYRDFIRRNSDIVLTGHEHVANTGKILESTSGESMFSEGGVLQKNGSSSESSFVVIDAVLANTSATVVFTTYAYSADKNAYRSGSNSTHNLDLEKRKISKLVLTRHFRKKIEDPGANFKISIAKDVSLRDIFVFPDIKITDETGDVPTLLSSRELLKSPPESKVFLKGLDNTGKTSLLYILYLFNYEDGQIPVYIEGKKIRHTSSEECLKLLRTAVEEQYGPESFAEFQQIERSRKILVLDDFDRSPIAQTKSRYKALDELSSFFGRTVVTVESFGAFTDLEDSGHSEDALNYTICPLGHVLRSLVISKWFDSYSSPTWTDSDIAQKTEHVRRISKSVMGRSLVPSSPFFLLTLLQSIFRDKSDRLEDRGLGYYYEFLISESLLDAGVGTDKLAEYYNYCTQLAWFIFKTGDDTITELELRQYNEYFSTRWHTVDFSARFKMLLEAKILSLEDGEISFRYPYIYYFFKAKFLADSVDKEDSKEYIRNCINGVHVKEQAETIVFLAHFSNAPYIISCVQSALNESFGGKPEADLASFNSYMASVVGNLPDVCLEERTPQQFRETIDREQDKKESQDKSYGQKPKVEINKSPSQGASDEQKLAALIKTLDIVGQILKTQYSSIERSRKAELISDVIRAPFRAMKDFFDFVEAVPSNLAKLIEEVGAHHGRRSDIEDALRSLIGTATLTVVSGLFIIIARCVGSDNLQEDLDAAVEISQRTEPSTGPSIGFLVARLAAKLDSPKPLPKKLILDLVNLTKGNILLDRVVKILVVNRLYMFDSSSSDMQFVQDTLKIPVVTQRKIQMFAQASGAAKRGEAKDL